ncbi:MAG: hypothetical protein WAP14_07815 [Acetomicrobium sp.]
MLWRTKIPQCLLFTPTFDSVIVFDVLLPSPTLLKSFVVGTVLRVSGYSIPL